MATIKQKQKLFILEGAVYVDLELVLDSVERMAQALEKDPYTSAGKLTAESLRNFAEAYGTRRKAT